MPGSKRVRFIAIGIAAGGIAVCCLFVSATAQAGDWPQILGPARNGAAAGETLVSSWHGKPSRPLWEREVGKGFAGVAVAGNTCVLFHRTGDVERVDALAADSGKPLWSNEFRAVYVPSFVDDDGPRAVPLIADNHVYLFGAQGGLYCVELETGKTVWARDTFKDYHTGKPSRGEPAEGYFGFGSTPLVEGDRLIVNVGGDEKGAGVVAFDRKTGKTVWTATNERASYSSPIARTIDGTRHLIVETRLQCVSLDPKDGSVRWTLPFGRRGPTVTAACPTILEKNLFLTASYGIGAVWAEVGRTEATVQWESDDVCSSQYTTCLEHEGLLYGIHGRQDIGLSELRCFDPRTKKIRWTNERFGYATLVKADGKLLAMTTDGVLVEAKLNPSQYEETGRAELMTGTTRALPALANGRWYVRNERKLSCFQIGKSSDSVK